eukprot:scaffold492995_cov22-Prasinocladus_malaysianus.AAC.1
MDVWMGRWRDSNIFVALLQILSKLLIAFLKCAKECNDPILSMAWTGNYPTIQTSHAAEASMGVHTLISYNFKPSNYREAINRQEACLKAVGFPADLLFLGVQLPPEPVDL